MEPASAQVLVPGATIGPYVVVERLGGGGMGQVYLARDTRLHRRVALKFLTAGVSGDEIHERILREARAAAGINHPNVAAVHDVVDAGGQTFIVMEYVDGESLSTRLTRGRLPLASVVSFGRQVASGLAAAHAEGIIHRDLKPSNVQISRAGVAKILDFGVAKATASIVATTTEARSVGSLEGDLAGRPGTPAYMSPEQLMGLPLDERSDIYSLGIVLLEMAAGRRTWLSAAGGTLRPSAHDAGVPRDLAAVIDRALETDPDRRFDSAEELDAALARVKVPKAAASWRPSRGHWIAVGLVLATLASVGGVYLFGAGRPTKSIAVLPLVSDSHDAARDSVTDAITDGLINMVGQMCDLGVVSRTSSMQYKNTTKSIKQIGEELKVTALLEGSVMFEPDPAGGERVRIAVNLVDPATQRQIWSATLDRELGSVAALQETVARTVAERLDVWVRGGDRVAGTKAVKEDAYKLYALGRQQWNLRTAPALQAALDYFHQAIAIEPTYAAAYAGLADTYVLLGGDFGVMAPREAADAATTNASLALSYDPYLADAYASLGFTNFFLKWNWEAAERHFRRALDLNKSYATAYHWYGNFLSDMGREEEGLEKIRRARDLSPLEPIISRDVAWPLFFSRRYDAAIQQLQTTLAASPGYLPADRLLARAEAMNGQIASAVARFENQRARDTTPRSRCELAWAYALAGRQDDAVRELEAARAMTGLQRYPYDEALALTALGRTAEALDALERAFAQRDPTMVNLRHDPRLDPLRTDPRFLRLLALMRFP